MTKRNDDKTADLFTEFDDSFNTSNRRIKNSNANFDEMIERYNRDNSRTHTGYELYFAHGNEVIHHAWSKYTPANIKR